MTFRWARSPVAPKRTSIDGSGTRSRRNPARRSFVSGLGRGAGRAGIGWSGGASTGAGSLGLTLGGRRVVATIRPLLGLDFVTAELVAERGEHLGAVGILLARTETSQQGERDDRSGDVMVDGLLDGPAPLAGVGHVAPDVLEVGTIRLECPSGELEEPRPHHRALHPQVRDAREVELVIARMHDLEALGVGLHQPVLDAVVDHLHVVARARTADVEEAAGWREGGEDGHERVDGFGITADHQAVADLETPDPAGRPRVDVTD